MTIGDGDALWALMVFLGLALLRPNLRPLPLIGLALLTCYLDEFFQLYQTPASGIYNRFVRAHDAGARGETDMPWVS